MKKFLVGCLALVGGLALVALVVVVMIGLVAVTGKKPLPRQVILELDFEAAIVEAIPEDPVAQLMLEDTLELRDVIDALDQAAGDRHVKAVVAHIGAGGMGLAHIQEVRDAVARFRASGKPAIAFAETFGEFGPGNGGYYLATAFDEIHLQPSGDVGLTGLVYESPFIRGMLEKLGLSPRMDQRREYKNAMNFYTDRGYTAPHREAMQRLLDSQFGQVVRGIAERRGLSEDEVRRLCDAGPYLGAEALEAKLVDRLSYRDEMLAGLEERVGDDAELLYVKPYLERGGRPHTRGATIALIHGHGAVVRGPSGYSPLDGSTVMGADTVAAALRAATRDRKVKAIVFRVDSPGGSYVASDTIWRETIRAREAGKPVIVSMGNVAGSGGYFVAMNADKIVAQPGTITASIGVLGGKLLTSGFWDKVGVSWDEVASSANATMWTGTHDYDPAEYARFEAGLDRIYEDFTAKVAAGRELPLEQVQEVARGRIWTGEDAKELGLVDELGGLDVALRLAREAVGVEPDAAIRIKRFPPPGSPIERLLGIGSDSSEGAALAASVARSVRGLQPAVRALERLAGGAERGVLSVPEEFGPVP